MADISSLSNSILVSAIPAAVNANVSALQNLFASSVAPASPVAYQLWWDTTTAASPILKVRNSANSAWITVIPNGGATAGGFLALTGGTMSAAIAMGSSKITGLANGTASGDAVNKGQVDARVRTLVIPVGTLSVSDNKYVALGMPACTVVDAFLVSELGVASSGTDIWTFQVRNLTAAVNLRSSAKSTNGSAITADTQYALGLDQNLTIAAGDVLQFQATKAASPNNLQELAIALKYTLAT